MRTGFNLGLAGLLAAGLAMQGGARATAQTTASDPAALPKLELSPDQRQVIFTSLTSQTHKSTAAPSTFGATVGAHVPDAVETEPLPATVVSLIPQLRGYDGAVVSEQVLIVEPKTRQIVDVITGKK